VQAMRPLDAAMKDACACAMSVEGHVREIELRLLYLAAALPTARGEVVEIGSFRGRSTVALAKGAVWAGQEKVVACDPFTALSPTDPVAIGSDYHGSFQATLERFGLSDHVEVHREFSADLAKGWTRPIRLLWIDGDHRYETVKADIEGFLPHLVPGAVIAVHDVASGHFWGPLACFMDDIVLSDRFGACGMCFRIGWAQYVGEGGLAEHRRAKRRAYRLLAAVRLAMAFGTKPRGLTRLAYKLFRKGRSFERWIRSAAGHR